MLVPWMIANMEEMKREEKEVEHRERKVMEAKKK